MDYNTSRKKLILPEYGRCIQQMVDHIVTVENRDERTRLAKSLINIMVGMNPKLTESPEYKNKLWDHLFIMSDFKLDVDSPYPIPEKQNYFDKPQPIDYMQNSVAHKHYGRIIEDMVKVAVEMEEGEKRDALKLLIANQMKRTNVNWNKDSASDEDIFLDLYKLSNGKLRLQPGTKLVEIKEIRNANNQKNQPNKKNNKRKHNKK